MIKSFKHRGLKAFWISGDRRKFPAKSTTKIRLILSYLNGAKGPDDLKSIPGGNLHKLSGDLKHFWSLRVLVNWRIIFRFEEDNSICDIDYLDYH